MNRTSLDDLADALCELDLAAGDALVVTASEGVQQRKLSPTELDALLEHAVSRKPE